MGRGKERVRATDAARLNAAEEEEQRDMLICVDRGKEKGRVSWRGGENENKGTCTCVGERGAAVSRRRQGKVSESNARVARCPKMCSAKQKLTLPGDWARTADVRGEEVEGRQWRGGGRDGMA